MSERSRPATGLSGRITKGPSELLHDEVLEPQFGFEAEHLLPHYVEIERVLAAEYLRMGMIEPADARDIDAVLAEVDRDTLVARPDGNMSDIAFALERHVEEKLGRQVVRWHVDRSRNDFQSCAQLMYGRRELLGLARSLMDFGQVAVELAERTREMPMPGYTHYQAAQIITPGFYLAAVGEQVLHSQGRLLHTYDGIDACPLGAGAMAGQELPWDRERMAGLLGFSRAQTSALTSVASRRWSAEVTAELSLLGAALSRFVTDLMHWGSSAHGFIELPDELAGISSAMPQKKNYPVLERVRGRTAHLAAFHLDVLLGQRNTPFSNLVEVSKEAGTHLRNAFESACGTITLFTEVLRRLEFRPEPMAEVCEREYLGGFSLANALTLNEGVPWRTAQVLAGRYIVLATDAKLPPRPGDPELLVRAAAEHGHELGDPEGLLRTAFDVRGGLLRMSSAGSAHPEAVQRVLGAQRDQYAEVSAQWAARADAGRIGREETGAALGRPAPGAEAGR